MATDILCRFDAAKREGVVFLADTMKVWVPLDYYHMTGPLSASDEKVLMERFKQATNRADQIVRLRQRLPRVSRPLPNMLAGGPATESVLPAVAPTALPQVATVVPVAGEMRSALLYRQILADNERLVQMQTVIGNLNQQIADITAQVGQFATEFEAAKASYHKLTVNYEQAIEEEAKALLEQRKAELAAVGQTPAHAVPPVPAPAVSVPVAAPKASARKAPAVKRTSRKPAAKKASAKGRK
uniref:Adhesin n=1 Tax=Globodera pallida TaxID=36090 RepID=A0A183CQI1_GLOPA